MVGIKDMNTPCDCWVCDCTYEDYRGATVCVFTRKPLYPMGSQEERDKRCPLVEVESEDCITVIQELNGLYDEAMFYGAVFIELLEKFMSPDDLDELCYMMKSVKGGCEWCRSQACSGKIANLRTCILKYAELRIKEMSEK